ncbi:hypothetical protein BT67DRAFT_447975 [Trichocladium antarcticum]|uniref:RING-type domain-containing protein n=1 Tax=Trichocladium antarcticum TaxID=1450529 RepID=A0AAN6UPN5_9PEZI|nr:hypothetical protein BT67DRAFT_447975 [Trichocladium antarcticum]
MFDNVDVNPSWSGVGTTPSTVIRNITAVSSRMAYSATFAGNTTVLSSRYAGTMNGIIQGLLYVPDLPVGHSCVEEMARHVPLTVARQHDLPPINHHLIGIAPWVSGRCADAYLTAARADPIRAFLFYMPGSASASPARADSPEWHIDNATKWMTRIGHPVYAVSGIVGEVLMQHLSLYSGNMTQVPFGQRITERFLSDPEDYLRIWTSLVVSTPSLPFGIWVYVLIVVGVLLAVISATSLLMHVAQAQRRGALRRRVISGEVNLEAMGIKRVTVPRNHIQTFPLFTYHHWPDTSSPPLSPRSAKPIRAHTRTRTRSLDQTSSTPARRVSRSATVSGTGRNSRFSASTVAADHHQPMCEICLEPYQSRATIIRELPCGHIFHPACIDEFLRSASSLCPMCKASMLPRGFSPQVTNAMVRRERATRRLRGRIVVHDHDHDAGPAPDSRRWWMAAKSRVFGAGGSPLSPAWTTRQGSSPPSATRSHPRPVQDPDGQHVGSSGAPTALTRERMRELAGFVEPGYGEGGRTRWQLVRHRIFPGFH